MSEQIKLFPDLEARVHQAVENFMQGYGCCQSVVAAFADLYGLSDEMAKRIGAGFGGGVGRMRMMCGAVSGIVILVGWDRLRAMTVRASRLAIRWCSSCLPSRRRRTGASSALRFLA